MRYSLSTKCSHTFTFTLLTKSIELDFCGLAVGLIPINSLFAKYHQDVFPCTLHHFTVSTTAAIQEVTTVNTGLLPTVSKS